MLRLECPDVVHLEEVVGVRAGLSRPVDHDRRPDQVPGRNLVHVVLVLARDPVDRRVEVRADVLAALEPVPVPGRSPLVVPTELVQSEPGRVRERRRQLDDRGLLGQRLREVNHLDGARPERVDQRRQRVGHGYVSPSSRRSDLANSNRFSSRCRSMWKLAGPTASTLATRLVSASVARSSRKAAVKPSSWSTILVPAMPAPRATAARSVPVPVAVGEPPTQSRLSLSKTTCVRLDGAYRAMVVSEPRFMSIDPSPSITTTLRSGWARAIPRPMELARPMACSR